MTTKEQQEAIEFILENPDQNDYVNTNFKNFMSGGNPDDNSIELDRYWAEQFKIVHDFLKRQLKSEQPEEKEKTAEEEGFSNVISCLNNCMEGFTDVWNNTSAENRNVITRELSLTISQQVNSALQKCSEEIEKCRKPLLNPSFITKKDAIEIIKSKIK